MEEDRFASVILPTGAGKSFVTIEQLMQRKDKEMLYLAPQDEILEQMKDYIIEHIHGPVNTFGRSKEAIIADVFPKLKFCTYPRLAKSKEGKKLIDEKYDFLVLDELHRTGAEIWGDALNTLLDNQPEETKVLGITATPRRDADGRNMANEIAERLGYTNKDATKGKQIAMNMSLTNAIRMGLLVNPKLVSCVYALKTDGSLDDLKDRIEQIENEEERNEELEKYNKINDELNALTSEFDTKINEQLQNMDLDDSNYEEARRNLEEMYGISKILQSNVKKGGKYIVFLPVVDDIEDEDGNKTGRLTGKDKIEEYQKKIAQYFEGSDITPKFHSMLGEYGDKGEEEIEED